MAEFPKGMMNFRNLIVVNFRKRKVKGHGKEHCELTFIVERDGSINSIKATGTNGSINKEAIRAVSKIKEKWISGSISGQKVRSRFRVPLDLTFE